MIGAVMGMSYERDLFDDKRCLSSAGDFRFAADVR